MRVRQIETEKLVPYARNPRHNEAAIDKVAASIREFGWKQPIVVDAQMTVIAGHTRLQAARKLEMGRVPIVVADDLTPEQVKAYRLADNRVNQDSKWDIELLGLELSELDKVIEDLDITGFSSDELSFYLKPPEFSPGAEGDQGALGELSPKMVKCPECGHEWDEREQK